MTDSKQKKQMQDDKSRAAQRPAQVSEDELDAVTGGLASVGGTSGTDPCLSRI